MQSVPELPIKSDDGNGGWTFIETIIVLAIIIVLTAIVGFSATRYLEKAKIAAAKTQIASLALAVQAYSTDCGMVPTTDQGLKALWAKPILSPVPNDWAGPYLDGEIGKDPWGNDWVYSVPGENGLSFGIESYGSDGKEGGEGNAKDLASWKK